ncbi:MAG: hypothetical protein ABEI53_00600 [Candidatus Magasanikbacteria bacterium]
MFKFILNNRQNKKDVKSFSSGQVMMMTVIVLGGVMIGASVVGGLLLRYQIRSVSNSLSSAKSVFAADTGIEAMAWCNFKSADCSAFEPSSVPEEGCPSPTGSFSDSSVCFEATSTLRADGSFLITSKGFSIGRTSTTRILQTEFKD